MACCKCCCEYGTPPGECCGSPSTCCKEPDICCGPTGSKTCCEDPRVCCGVGSGQECCPEGDLCCGEECCPPSQECCGEGESQVCCNEGQYCCDGVCQDEPCCETDEDCPTLYTYWATATVADIPDGCFAGGPGWTSSGGQVKDWSYSGKSIGVYYCTTGEALDAANAVLPTLTGACAPSASVAFYGTAVATGTCEDGACVYVVNDNDPASLTAALDCGPP
jgi:hypothetical protein